jgi:hypothetical protein
MRENDVDSATGIPDRLIERGGTAGRYFFYRPGEVLLVDATDRKVDSMVGQGVLLAPSVPALGGDDRSKQREAKRVPSRRPFDVRLMYFNESGRPIEKVLDDLAKAGITAHYNYVSSRTPMWSHAVSYAEPADVRDIKPHRAAAPRGEGTILVGVLDTGRPRYTREFREYYLKRFERASTGTGGQTPRVPARHPLDETDDMFVEGAPSSALAQQDVNSQASQAQPDRDTMVRPFGRLSHQHAGHGLFVSSIIARHAPNVRIIAEATMYEDSIADLFEILVDLEDTVAKGCVLLNMSLGFRTEHRPGATAGNLCPPAMKQALRVLKDREILLVASAGNDGSDREVWPAAHPDVVAVAATDDSGAPTDWSNYGPWVDACAFGNEVVSHYAYADWDFPDGTAKRFRGAASWSGTSFAAPLVTAVIAKEADERRCSPMEAWKRMKAQDREKGPMIDGYGVRLGPLPPETS